MEFDDRWPVATILKPFFVLQTMQKLCSLDKYESVANAICYQLN